MPTDLSRIAAAAKAEAIQEESGASPVVRAGAPVGAIAEKQPAPARMRTEAEMGPQQTLAELAEGEAKLAEKAAASRRARAGAPAVPPPPDRGGASAAGAAPGPNGEGLSQPSHDQAAVSESGPRGQSPEAAKAPEITTSDLYGIVLQLKNMDEKGQVFRNDEGWEYSPAQIANSIRSAFLAINLLYQDTHPNGASDSEGKYNRQAIEDILANAGITRTGNLRAALATAFEKMAVSGFEIPGNVSTILSEISEKTEKKASTDQPETPRVPVGQGENRFKDWLGERFEPDQAAEDYWDKVLPNRRLAKEQRATEEREKREKGEQSKNQWAVEVQYPDGSVRRFATPEAAAAYDRAMGAGRAKAETPAPTQPAAPTAEAPAPTAPASPAAPEKPATPEKSAPSPFDTVLNELMAMKPKEQPAAEQRKPGIMAKLRQLLTFRRKPAAVVERDIDAVDASLTQKNNEIRASLPEVKARIFRDLILALETATRRRTSFEKSRAVITRHGAEIAARLREANELNAIIRDEVQRKAAIGALMLQIGTQRAEYTMGAETQFNADRLDYLAAMQAVIDEAGKLQSSQSTIIGEEFTKRLAALTNEEPPGAPTVTA